MKNTPVSEILAVKGSHVYTISPEATILEAVRHMNHHKIGALVVVVGDELVGMFTERDVLVRVVDARRDPSTTTVEEAMTQPLLTISPSTTLETVMQLMTEKRHRHLPVAANGRLEGMISIGDVNRWQLRESDSTIQHLYGYITSSYAP